MMDRPAGRINPRSLFRRLVVLAGAGLLAWSTLAGAPAIPLTPDLAAASLLILLFCAILAFFPLMLFEREAYLSQAVLLAGALLYNLPAAGWAAAIGLLLGAWARRLWRGPALLDSALARPAAPTPVLERDPVFQAGLQSLALALALPLASWLTGGMAAPWIHPALSLLAFALLHGLLLLLDARLGGPPPLAGAASLALLELYPLPFILLAVMNAPSLDLGTLAFTGCLSIAFAILLSWVSITRLSLRRRVDELSTLNQVSQVLRSTLELENLLSVIHVEVTQLLGVNNFYVALYDAAETGIWYPLAVKRGVRQSWPPRPLEDRLTDRVIRERTPLRLSSLASGNGSLAGLPPSESTPTAWLGVPLVSSERALGCLALFSLEEGASFTHADQELLTTLSGQISVAIENALLFEQAQRRAEQLETLNRTSALMAASLDPQEVLAQVCQGVAQVSGGQRSAIYLLEREESRVTLAHAHGLPEAFIARSASFSLVGGSRARCLRTARPCLYPSLAGSEELDREHRETLLSEGIQACCDLPLAAPEGQIGFLSVYYDAPHAFRPEEVELLQTFASEAALAVANARLYARTDLALSERARQLSILEAVGRELSAAINSERLFDMILDFALEFTGSPWGSIGLYNPASRTIEIKASRGYPRQIFSYSVDRGISGRAVRARQTVISGKVSHDPEYIDATEGAARSQISVPLAHEGRVLGVLTLESPQPDLYTTSDQAFLSQLAGQAAVAVVNAELYSETQRRLREQSTLYLVSARLAGKLELESVLDTVQRALEAALERAAVGVYIWDEAERQYTMHRPAGRPPSAMRPTIRESELDLLNLALAEPAPLQSTAGLQFPEALLDERRMCHVIVFPMVSNRQRLGMALLHLSGPARPDEDDLKLLSAIVSQGALSLQNARLFSDVSHGRDRLDAVLNTVREGLVMVEAGGRIMLANESVQAITGLQPAALTGRRLDELDDETLALFGYTRPEVERLLGELRQGLAPQDPRLNYKLGEGKGGRYIERSSLPVWGSSGRATGWMVVLRDVTEEHEVEQARELITETLVHDLRSPLSSVIAALDVLSDKELSGEPSGELAGQALQVARRSSQRVLGMVEALLDISRMEAGMMDLNLGDVHLQAMAATLFADFAAQAREFGLILRSEIPAGLPPVCADPAKISRVLMNLLDNALKFTPTGGQVTLSAEPYEEGWVALRVSDTGPGIPAEFREKIFDRFSQVPGQKGRRRGSGLGLTFCRLAVEAHGGRIWVESGPGGTGSVFLITLPVGPCGGEVL